MSRVFDAETTFTYNFTELKSITKEMFELHNKRLDAAFTVLNYLHEERAAMSEQIKALEKRVKELEGRK